MYHMRTFMNYVMQRGHTDIDAKPGSQDNVYKAQKRVKLVFLGTKATKDSDQPWNYTLVGPTVTRLVQDP